VREGDRFIPEEKRVKFRPGGVYNRTEVRKYLSEYLLCAMRWSRQPVERIDDNQRFYYMTKAVKDFIVETKKMEFTFDEVSEIIESKSILTYANDMVQKMLEDWVVFMDHNICQHHDVDCTRDPDDHGEYLRPAGSFLLNPIFHHVAHFIENQRDARLFFEKVTEYDDWEEYLPIITAQSAANDSSADLSFFSLP
jgi:hypothetical protein